MVMRARDGVVMIGCQRRVVLGWYVGMSGAETEEKSMAAAEAEAVRDALRAQVRGRSLAQGRRAGLMKKGPKCSTMRDDDCKSSSL